MGINDIKRLAVERIYLVPDASEGQLSYLWCDDPAPSQGMDPAEAVEYVRKDVHDAALAELERERDAYRTAEEHQIARRQKADEREAALENRNAGLIQQCQDAEDQRDEYLNKLRALNHGDKSKAWHWMGDGNDHPESLCCPVLISSEDLNGIISGREAALEREAALAAHVESIRYVLVDAKRCVAVVAHPSIYCAPQYQPLAKRVMQRIESIGKRCEFGSTSL